MLEALAAVILVGLMLVPIVNMAVGFIAGLVFGGPFGVLLGLGLGYVLSWMYHAKTRGY